ncbi:MAG: SIS domain-containing protein, partial [Egibacteraceae bacterium]
ALRDPDGEHERVRRRFEVTATLLPERVWQVDLQAEGSSPLARLASLVAQADLVSVYTAMALDRDPTSIHNIDRLKRELDRS